MPRQLKRVDSSEVQGEGSYVVLKPPRWGDIKQLRKLSDDDPESVATAEKVIADAVVEWNWADDAGQPLPLPSATPDVLDDLWATEVTWLLKALTLDTEQAKN